MRRLRFIPPGGALVEPPGPRLDLREIVRGLLALAQRLYLQTGMLPLAHHLWYTRAAAAKEADTPGRREPILRVVFFRTDAGIEPVRSWLKDLSREARKAIGDDIKTAQYGWPLGMPLIRKLEPGLWEVRSRIPEGIVRVVFTVGEGNMVLLHGFLKKSQKTPPDDLKTARQRLAVLKGR